MAVIADRIYLDAASIEPLRSVARDAFHEALDDGWADPLRLHSEARRARTVYAGARETVAATLRCRPDEVTFVGSSTDAVVRGLSGLLRGRARTGRHLVHSTVEHSSVLHTARAHVSEAGTTTEDEIRSLLDTLEAVVGDVRPQIGGMHP